MFKDGNEKLYPDFYRDNFILDAKYKHLNSGAGCEDLYQVVTYMYCRCAKHGGYLYPDEGKGEYCQKQLVGYEGFIHYFPFKVPQNAVSHEEFVKQIKEEEKELVNKIENIC